MLTIFKLEIVWFWIHDSLLIYVTLSVSVNSYWPFFRNLHHNYVRIEVWVNWWNSFFLSICDSLGTKKNFITLSRLTFWFAVNGYSYSSLVNLWQWMHKFLLLLSQKCYHFVKPSGCKALKMQFVFKRDVQRRFVNHFLKGTRNDFSLTPTTLWHLREFYV